MDDSESFKIVLIGSVGTGKTNIALRYINNQFNENSNATVGVEFLKKMVKVRNRSVKVTLWDTAGQQRYKSLSKVYYKGANGVIIVYDTTNLQSYLDVQSWMRLVNEHLNLSEIVVMVVGNKIDNAKERAVPYDRALKEYQNKLDIDCREVSAKSGAKVQDLFEEMVGKIYEKYLDSQAVRADLQRAQQEQLKRREAETNGQVKITPASIKKQPQIKNKKTTLEDQGKKREKQARQKKKGCC